MAETLLSIPADAGRAIIEAGSVIACPLLGTDGFVTFCRERRLTVNRERLLRLEKLGLFSPVFRVRDPGDQVPQFRIPLREGENWFETGWAWDTTSVDARYAVPDANDSDVEGYFSIFEIDYLHTVLKAMTLHVQLDSYLDCSNGEEPQWQERGRHWMEIVAQEANILRKHEYRRSRGLLCQFISNRYYPETQGDMRTVQLANHRYSDRWVNVGARDWDWYEVVQRWKPQVVERVFQLTPEKLKHAYRGLAGEQAGCDPLERWYQLTQFVSLREREQLKGAALRAETLRSGAQMLRLLYKDLYGTELPHPNEISGTIITHIPEIEARADVRRYLELVVNRFGLNPRPKLTLIVEGATEEIAVHKIFEQYFGAHPGTYGIEISVLGGVDNATGSKEDRFRAIIRLVDYLHSQQTVAFLILDNERHARKLKHRLRGAKSIHYRRRYVTRPEFVRVWACSFEFDNFSCYEIAAALTKLSPEGITFSASEVISCKKAALPAASLSHLYRRKTASILTKTCLIQLLVEEMFSKESRRKVGNRPIIKLLERVSHLAALNHFPIMQQTWEKNQASTYLGKKR
jgi:hypothetical protein